MGTYYPHVLRFDQLTGSTTTIDANGDKVVIPGIKTTIEIKCRFEPNGSGEYIVSEDGAKLDFGWVVYQPLGQMDIPNGILVKGYLGDKQIASGTIKRFSRGKFNARAWV